MAPCCMLEPGCLIRKLALSPCGCPQIRVRDGRVLEGDLHCLDKLGNIILNNTNQLADRSPAFR